MFGARLFGCVTVRLRTMSATAAFGAIFMGCAVPVAADLDDSEANRVLVALDRAGVEATREPDPSGEGRWRVQVAQGDMPRALAAMNEEQLPRRNPTGVLEAVAKGALVPSEASEHAQLMAGVAGDLERSLETVDGVLSARVHLSMPMGGGGRDAVLPRPSAAVLIEHKGALSPMSADAVQRLVAGAVAGMLTTDVAVVLVSHTTPGAAPEADGLAHVGPIAVARTSMRKLQAALVVLIAAVAALTASTLALYARLARARAAAAAGPPIGR